MIKLPPGVHWPLIGFAVYAAAWVAGQDTDERYEEIAKVGIRDGWAETKPADCSKSDWGSMRWVLECKFTSKTNEEVK